MKYRIDNQGCQGAFCFDNETSRFISIGEAAKGAEWLHKNHSWRTFPYHIVEIETGKLVHTINED